MPGSCEQGPYYSHYLTEERRETRCFSNFLRQHVNVGFERGFQDNISKHGGVNSGERLGPPLWEVGQSSPREVLYILYSPVLS